MFISVYVSRYWDPQLYFFNSHIHLRPTGLMNSTLNDWEVSIWNHLSLYDTFILNLCFSAFGGASKLTFSSSSLSVETQGTSQIDLKLEWVMHWHLSMHFTSHNLIWPFGVRISEPVFPVIPPSLWIIFCSCWLDILRQLVHFFHCCKVSHSNVLSYLHHCRKHLIMIISNTSAWSSWSWKSHFCEINSEKRPWTWTGTSPNFLPGFSTP